MIDEDFLIAISPQNLIKFCFFFSFMVIEIIKALIKTIYYFFFLKHLKIIMYLINGRDIGTHVDLKPINYISLKK